MRRSAVLLCLSALASAAAQNVTKMTVTASATTFRVGERIPLTITFTAPADAHVRIFPGPDGQRGLTSPGVDVTPASGWSDPHPETDHPGGFSGAMLGPVELSDKPLVRSLDLNEYVRFEKPGEYSVVIHTATRFPFRGDDSPAMPVAVSAPIKLHIVAPTAEWQAQTLVTAVNALKERAGSPRTFPDTQSDALYSTIAALDTDAALREMASHLDDGTPPGFSNRQRIYTAALTGLQPSRMPAALAAMRSVLNTPDASISSEFLNVLSKLEPGGDVPENWQHASETAWNEIAATVPAHARLARAEIADILSRFNPPSPEARASLARYIADGFDKLSPDRQSMVLEYSWLGLRSPAMLGEVQRLAQLPVKKLSEHGGPDHAVEVSASNRLRVVALRRWYELDPSGATAYIQQQIGTEQPSYGASDLSFLPHDPMPQFESIWGTALANGNSEYAGRLTSLLARFGAGNATAQVGAYVDTVLASRENTCGGADPSAVAYLVRFDTERARVVLAEERVHAGPRCGGNIPFNLIAAQGNGPALEEAAIATLNDDRSHNVWDTASYLRRYGTPAARKPLEDRLARFLTETPESDERPDFYDRSPEAMALMKQVGFGQALMQAVLEPQGWLPTPQDRAALLAQCHLQMCQGPQPAALDRLQLSVQDWGGDGPHYNLSPFPGQTLEELKAKLNQLPPGTAIVLLPPTPETAESHKKAAEAIAAAHLRLVSQ